LDCFSSRYVPQYKLRPLLCKFSEMKHKEEVFSLETPKSKPTRLCLWLFFGSMLHLTGFSNHSDLTLSCSMNGIGENNLSEEVLCGPMMKLAIGEFTYI